MWRRWSGLFLSASLFAVLVPGSGGAPMSSGDDETAIRKLVQDEVVFIRPDVAIVEVLTSVSGVTETSPGTVADSKGRLRTRLLQVVAKTGGEWKIAAYHNVDVKPGVPVPEPL